MLKKIITITLAIVLAITTSTYRINAEGDPVGVSRGGDTKTFIKDGPIGTITIDTANMTPKNEDMTVSIPDHFKVYKEGNGRFKNAIVWAPNGLEHETVTLEKGESVEVEGEIVITYPGIATLQDGSTADVQLTISQVQYINAKGDVYGPITVYFPDGKGGYIGPVNSKTNQDPRDGGAGASVSMQCEINVKIVKDGSPVEGTVLFATYDLDQPGVGRDYQDEHAESFRVDSGSISKAYIPDENLLNITGVGSEQSANGLKFTATKNDSSTYNSGFATLADAAEGITLHWWGNGNGMGTSLFTGNISHNIKSTTTKGGNIQTTVNGNHEGNLNDGSDVLGPVSVDVPDGKTVVYTMTPEEGHKLDKVVVDGKEIEPAEHKDEEGNVYYTFEFPENDADHTIDVSWKPFSYKINYDSNGGQGEMTSDTFIYTDETMKSKENTFTKQGQHFVGFKALDKDGNPLKDKDGNELPLFKSAEDFKDYLVEKGDGAEITLQAQWEADKYTVKYDPNGGDGKMSDQHFTGDDEKAMSKENKFIKEGYTFIGFKALDKDGNPLKDKDGNELPLFESVQDLKEYLTAMGNGAEIILQAQWQKKESKSNPTYKIPSTGIE